MWKHLGNEDGNGFGYCEYWHFEDPAHPEHPSEIPETMDYEHGSGILHFVGQCKSDDRKVKYDIYQFTDQNYLYIIHVHAETWNYFRYELERGAVE